VSRRTATGAPACDQHCDCDAELSRRITNPEYLRGFVGTALAGPTAANRQAVRDRTWLPDSQVYPFDSEDCSVRPTERSSAAVGAVIPSISVPTIRSQSGFTR